MLFAIVSRGKKLGTRLFPHRFNDNRYHVQLGKEGPYIPVTDHRDLVGRRARSGGERRVIGLALEARHEIAHRAEQRKERHDEHAKEPVGFPETRLHYPRAPLLFREKILRYGLIGN